MDACARAPKFSANLSILFQEVPFLERFGAAARAGFKAVEFMFPYEYAVADLRQALSDNGLQLVLINLPAGNFAADGSNDCSGVSLSLMPAKGEGQPAVWQASNRCSSSCIVLSRPAKS